MRQLVSLAIWENSEYDNFIAIEEQYITMNERKTVVVDHVTNECVIVNMKRIADCEMSHYCMGKQLNDGEDNGDHVC